MVTSTITHVTRAAPSVLELVRSVDYGGRTVRILAGVEGLRKHGFEVALATFAAPTADALRRHPSLRECIVLGLSSHFDPRAIVRLHRLIRNRGIALIHAHSEDAYLYGGLAALWNRIPIIGTFHRSTPDSYEPKRASRLWNALLTHQVAVSRDRLLMMLSQSRTPPDRISLIWGAADVGRFHSVPHEERLRLRNQLGIPLGNIALLGVGHLGLIKGHDLSIRAMPAILSEFPAARLFLAGEGRQEDCVRVQRLISDLGLTRHVDLLGHINNPEEWMAACDIFVQPPRDEAFGLVFAEASSACCPIVATAVGGIPEIVVHDETGLLVPREDVAALSIAVLKLLRDPHLRRELGARAQVRAHTHFTSEAMAAAYAGLAHRLLQTPCSTLPRAGLAADPSELQHCSHNMATKL